MTVYLTKVWGFGEPCGPLQFSTKGWRDRARAELKPDDLVILVGTKGEPTDKDDQGRVLGMMEPTTQIVLSMDFDLPTRKVDFNDEGEYRWVAGPEKSQQCQRGGPRIGSQVAVSRIRIALVQFPIPTRLLLTR